MDAAQWENISNNLGSVSNIKGKKKRRGKELTSPGPTTILATIEKDYKFKACLVKLMRPCLKINQLMKLAQKLKPNNLSSSPGTH